MKVGNGEADTITIYSESTVVSNDFDIWSLVWICWWASDFTEIVATLVLDWFLESEDHIVPSVGIRWVREADEVVIQLSELVDLTFDLLLSHSSFSLESHLTGV